MKQISREDVTFNTTVYDQAGGVIDIDGGRIIYRVECTGNRPRYKAYITRQVLLPYSKAWQEAAHRTVMIDRDVHERIAEVAEELRKVV